MPKGRSRVAPLKNVEKHVDNQPITEDQGFAEPETDKTSEVAAKAVETPESAPQEKVILTGSEPVVKPKRKPGPRARLPENMITTSFNLSQEDVEFLDSRSEASRKSKSELLREILAEYKKGR